MTRILSITVNPNPRKFQVKVYPNHRNFPVKAYSHPRIFRPKTTQNWCTSPSYPIVKYPPPGSTTQTTKCLKSLVGDSKTKIVTVRNNKSKRQSLDISVNNTRIETVDRHKYLSMYMNTQGSLTETIERRKAPLKKLSFELSSLLKRNSNDKKQLFVNGILLYNSIVKSILLYAGETWTNITKTQCNKLEQIQAKTLKTILGLEKSTPNIGLLNELGILPIEFQLKKMRLMFLHKISSLPNSRLVKQVFNEQRRIGFPNCWWEEVKQDLVWLNLPTSTDDITESSKSLWGKEID